MPSGRSSRSWATVGASRGCARAGPTWTGSRAKGFRFPTSCPSVSLAPQAVRSPYRPPEPPQRRRQQPHALPICRRDLRDALARGRRPHGYFGKWHMGSSASGLDSTATPTMSARESTTAPCSWWTGSRRRLPGWPTSTRRCWRSSSPAPTPAGRSSRSSVLRRRTPRAAASAARRHVDLGACSPHRRTRSAAPSTRHPYPSGMSTETVRDYIRSLGGVDQNIGVLDAIGQTGLADDTVVVFASETASSCARTGIPEVARTATSATPTGIIRIPLLLRYPRPAGKGPSWIRGANSELAPACWNAGHARPTSTQGRNWVPLLSGGSTSLVRHSCTNTSSRAATKCSSSLACGGTATSWCTTRGIQRGRAVQRGRR